MSHIVEIKTEIRDSTAILAACNRLALGAPIDGIHELFAGQMAIGLAVQLPEWRYPIVCETASGRVRFDNFGGRWGRVEELERFLQAYAIEKTLMEVRRQGHTAIEQSLADGSIKLVVQLNGGVA